MAKSGYIKLERKLFDSELWTAEPFTPGQAWVDLIAMANYADRDKFYRGTFQRVKRGQIVTSKLALAARWKWSDGRVRRYLATLEAAQMLRIDSGPNGVLLTVENYSLYQDARRTNSGPYDEPTTNARRTDDEPTTTQEGILSKDNPIKERETRARGEVPASAGDVATFVLDNNLDVDPDAFWNYYEANGWVTKAGTPVRNWKALCRTWHGKPQYNTTKTDAPADPDGLTPEMRASVERVKERRRNEHR